MLSNLEAGAKFWSDSRAQRVPYGRGFMYLARVDAQIREKSSGKRSLDTLVLQILARQRRGERVGVSEWVVLVTRELGEVARADFQDMVAGRLIVPPQNSFGPCFRPVSAPERAFDLGFDEGRLGVVTNLRAESAAAAAGVKEGDTIVAMTPLREVRSDSDRLMELTIKRGDQQLRLSYAPRGLPVASWHWIRVPGVPDAACKL
jgi:predicted metalloprotease with PDZ domain